jgi:hypothetical protein
LLIVEVQLLKELESGTSMIRCAAAMAFAAVSCSYSLTTRTNRPKRLRNSSPDHLGILLSFDGGLAAVVEMWDAKEPDRAR